MMKIKVSYITDEELAEITRLLAPVTVKKKLSSNQEGKYKKAYFEIEQRANNEEF